MGTKPNPHHIDYFTSLNNRWMSLDDLRGALQRAKSLRTKQSNLIAGLEGKIDQLKQSLEESTKFLTPSERLTVITRSTTAKRKELKESSAPERLKLVQDIAIEHQAIMSADLHWTSPVQVLMRSSIGKERRSLIAGQIADAGPQELLSFAHLAAATADLEMGAAVVTRLSTIPATKRPFSSQAIAQALVGAQFDEAELIFSEIEQVIVFALAEDKKFETGREDALGKIKAGLLARRIDAQKDRQVATLDDKPRPGAGVVGTTPPNQEA